MARGYLTGQGRAFSSLQKVLLDHAGLEISLGNGHI